MQSESTFFVQVLLHRFSQHQAGRSQFTLHANLEHLEVEYYKSRKAPVILALSLNFEIPLLSSLKEHAKCLDFFQLGAEYGWGGLCWADLPKTVWLPG
jgi:hypothetical protein